MSGHPLTSVGRLFAVGLAAVVIGLGAGRWSSVGSPTGASPGTSAGLGALQAQGARSTAEAVLTGDPSHYAAAEGAFDQADALSPDHPLTLVGRGNLALSLHDFATALDLGRQATAALPADAAALGVLVDAQVELGRYDAAGETLQRMLDRNPALPSLSRASYLRQLSGDLDGAVEAMRRAAAAGVAGSPDVAVVTALVGDLELERGDLVAAADAYRDALVAEPRWTPAHVGLARVEAATGDGPAAVARLEALVDRVPDVAALALLADLHQAAGRHADATTVAEVARSVAQLQASAGQTVDLELALLEADVGDPSRAVELARAAYDARPHNVFTAGALAWALHRAGRSDAAVPYAEQSLRLGTADAGLRLRSGLVLASNGHDAAARAALEPVAGGNHWALFAGADDVRATAERLGLEWR